MTVTFDSSRKAPTASCRPVGRGLCVEVAAAEKKAAAGQVILLDQDRRGTGMGGGQRGCQPRGTAADDQNIAMPVAFVVLRFRGLRVDLAMPGKAANET